MGILFALAKALEARDDNTSSHSLNVTRYSMLLGEHLGLDEEELRALSQGALLHDLGKIGIPDNILKKPGDLDDAEFEIIKKHPMMTSDILDTLETSHHFAAIARSHHERWDGTGYPDGLYGENIPLLARIVAIADAWDAMTSNRVYRDAMSENIALDIFEREKNSGQWDPYLVDKFIKLMRQGKDCSKYDLAV
ncbi:MAG: HD-GYP domain-containing protein [Deltaproteobacteria bacterium]|jgi:putative nucleotidyltransferase with HDIG domain|nr:HD-GYP domain-containing protein [Deltaproteobacteria bacterium]